MQQNSTIKKCIQKNEKIIRVTSLFMENTNFLFAQNNVANNYTKTGPVDRFQNVKTQTINVGGTDFYYRKLGENNPDAPVSFLTT